MAFEQKKIKKGGRLLDEKGRLRIYGRSDSILLGYSRGEVSALKQLRIKETDHYIFGNDNWQVDINISDNSLFGFVGVSLINLSEQWDISHRVRKIFTFGKFGLPCNSDSEDTVFRSEDLSLNITGGNGQRRIVLRCLKFQDVKELYLTAVFTQPKQNRNVWVSPLRGKHGFYYTDKINCMPVEAVLHLGAQTISFSPDSTLGSFDMHRSTLGYGSRMLQYGVNSFLDGEPFGFNISAGFGIRDECGENVVYYKGRKYLLDEVEAVVPKGRRYGTWLINSGENVSLRMRPIYEREFAPKMSRLAGEESHQVFGRYFGTLTLHGEDGSEEKVTLDGITGFASDRICRS